MSVKRAKSVQPGLTFENRIINWGSSGIYFNFNLSAPDEKNQGNLVWETVEGEYRVQVIEEEPTTEKGAFSYHFLIKVED